jgi:hypothetical protein
MDFIGAYCNRVVFPNYQSGIILDDYERIQREFPELWIREFP